MRNTALRDRGAVEVVARLLLVITLVGCIVRGRVLLSVIP